MQRYTARVRDDDAPLTGWIIERASVQGWYGSPRITGMLRNEGQNVNHKRVERVWREAGLKVPSERPRSGKLRLNDGSGVRLRPGRQDHVWAYDFVLTRTHEGLPLRLLVMVHEWTRECLLIDVARQLGSDDVLERLSNSSKDLIRAQRSRGVASQDPLMSDYFRSANFRLVRCT